MEQQRANLLAAQAQRDAGKEVALYRPPAPRAVVAPDGNYPGCVVVAGKAYPITQPGGTGATLSQGDHNGQQAHRDFLENHPLPDRIQDSAYERMWNPYGATPGRAPDGTRMKAPNMGVPAPSLAGMERERANLATAEKWLKVWTRARSDAANDQEPSQGFIYPTLARFLGLME